MQRVTISIEDDLLEKFDQYAHDKGYTNRSEGMRDAVRQLIANDEIAERENSECVGCVVYVYNHGERALTTRLVKAQHHHHEIPTATLHLHLDAENCLETTVLRGKVGEVRRMADDITSQTGVKYGFLHVIPTGDL